MVKELLMMNRFLRYSNKACKRRNYILMYWWFPMMFIQHSVKIWLAVQHSVKKLIRNHLNFSIHTYIHTILYRNWYNFYRFWQHLLVISSYLLRRQLLNVHLHMACIFSKKILSNQPTRVCHIYSEKSNSHTWKLASCDFLKPFTLESW